MPWPRVVARLNKRYTNRFIQPIVSRFPGFTLVQHQGRHSGRSYTTPLYSFAADSQIVIALTYGMQADWAKNVLAGGGTIRRTGSAESTIVQAEVVDRKAAWPHLPLVTRAALRLLRVTDFMMLTTD